MQALRQQLLKWVPDHEATLILFHLFHQKNPSLKTFADLTLITETPSPEIETAALQIAQDRAKGIPLQHLLGTQFFLNHDYFVDASTLIPRPETEVLATLIIEFAKKNFHHKAFRFAELGLGTGILSIELMASCLGASGVASELNFSAIALAEKNLQSIIGRSWSSRFQIIQASDPLEGFESLLSRAPYDLVFSNPPYVALTDEIEAEVLDHEPATALFPLNRDPNFFYENFSLHASKLLKSGGAAFFEVPHERAEDLLKSFQSKNIGVCKVFHDLTGRPRVIRVLSC